jgi:nickel superoxide dismutase
MFSSARSLPEDLENRIWVSITIPAQVAFGHISKKPESFSLEAMILKKGPTMSISSVTKVYAHCDLPCGVYDPAQARIEALSVKACMEKYAASTDNDFKARSVAIKEERSHQVKEHLWVLWTDYFKPNHFEAYPQLHGLFNEATKLAGAAGTKGTNDVAVADKLIAKIDEIAEIFWATKKA